MKAIETKIPGVLIIETDVYGDYRGYFTETYNKNKKEIRAQVAAFQEAVWNMQDSMEEADDVTGEDTTDETQE